MHPSRSTPTGSADGSSRRFLAVSRFAAASYMPCFLVATILSVRRGHKAAPLGLHTPFPVAVDAAVGIGTGLAAPWPLIVWLWRARRRAIRGGNEGRRHTAGLALLGALFLAGAAAEPVSLRLIRGGLRPAEEVLVRLNFVLPVVMLGGAWMALAAHRDEPSLRNAAGTPFG